MSKKRMLATVSDKPWKRLALIVAVFFLLWVMLPWLLDAPPMDISPSGAPDLDFSSIFSFRLAWLALGRFGALQQRELGPACRVVDVFKTFVFFTDYDQGHPHLIDTIRHEEHWWLVGSWLQSNATGERMGQPYRTSCQFSAVLSVISASF